MTSKIEGVGWKEGNLVAFYSGPPVSRKRRMGKLRKVVVVDERERTRAVSVRSFGGKGGREGRRLIRSARLKGRLSAERLGQQARGQKKLIDEDQRLVRGRL